VSAPQVYVYDTNDAVINNLTTYTEVDTDGVLSVTSSTATVTSCYNTTDSYLYYDHTATPFNGDFLVRFSINVGAASMRSSGVYAWGLSNYVDNLYTSMVTNLYAGYVVRISLVTDTSVYIGLVYTEAGAGTTGSSVWCILSKGTEYVIEVSRDYSVPQLTMEVFSSDKSTKHYSGTMVCGTETMNYMYAFSSYKTSTGTPRYPWTGIVKNSYTNVGKIPIYTYDTRVGGSDEMYVFPESVYEEQKGDYNQPTESFQFDVSLTSGGFMIERLVSEISASRRV